MQKDFWLEKWQNNQTGFHKSSVHPLLIKYLNSLSLEKGDTVFVPLCGKSIDMLWLNDLGYKVIGVELSELAVEQLFAENQINFTKIFEEKFVHYEYQNIRIYQGDFFNLNHDMLENTKAVYDRAAFIALPDDIAKRYTKKMYELFNENVKTLLITLEFEKKRGPTGPPFSTTIEKVNQFYKDYFNIRLLEEIDIINEEPKFQEQGCDFLLERCYLLENL